jgi:serine/threonine protein kinase
VKVTDFGIAATFEDGNETEDEPGQSNDYTPLDLTGETGTYRWMSPECIRHEPYSYRCDVYSFAVMMWQFLSREEPFNDVSAVEAAELTAIEKKRPPMLPLIPKQVKDVIETNWSDDPNKRWDFSRITEELKALRNSLSSDDLSYLEEPHGHPIQALEGLFEGGNDETEKRHDGNADVMAIPASGRHRDAKRSLGRRDKSWKSRNSVSPSRKLSPGRRPSLLSSFFWSKTKG